jgi:D-arabinose 5-phosphate isomerase GutQ
LDFNSFIRAVLPAGPTVPALLRIFHVGNTLIPGGFHVYGIGRANGIAQAAAGTFIHVKDRGHFLSSIEKASSVILPNQS